MLREWKMPSLRGAKRRSNPDGKDPPLDCFASLAMTWELSSLRGAKRRSNPDGDRPSTGLLRPL
ncbi:MAG: hypothetical protein LBT00_03390 [Spirochaetaceae bacterium]|nr:hypothetical protein [Spirochaetaceae bacterium]